MYCVCCSWAHWLRLVVVRVCVVGGVGGGVGRVCTIDSRVATHVCNIPRSCSVTLPVVGVDSVFGCATICSRESTSSTSGTSVVGYRTQDTTTVFSTATPCTCNGWYTTLFLSPGFLRGVCVSMREMCVSVCECVSVWCSVKVCRWREWTETQGDGRETERCIIYMLQIYNNICNVPEMQLTLQSVSSKILVRTAVYCLSPVEEPP